MIIKSSTRGSRGLGAHLAAEENEVARVTAAEGILGGDTESAVAELSAQGAASRTAKPLVHASISPDEPMSDEQWQRAWSEWERARGLTGQPYLEVEHAKKGRVHRHRVYCRVDVDRGAVIRQSHEMKVNERVARSLEAEFGHALTLGRHSRAVQRWAQAHGEEALAQRVAAAAERDRPTAAMRHNQWQQAERTGVDPREIQSAAVEAWQQSDSAAAFEAALAERGLALAQGQKTVQLVDHAGGTHDLRRTLRQGGQRVRKADVQAMTPEQIAGVDEVREAQRAARTAAAAPESAVDHGGPGTETEGPQAEPAPAAASVTHESEPAEPATALGTASEVSRIQQRLGEIDDQLERMPTPGDRDAVAQFERVHAIREARTSVRLRRSGQYATLDELDEHAQEMRSTAYHQRAAVDGYAWWQFRARRQQKKRAEQAEQRAAKWERRAVRERERIEADPTYWQAQVDDALARYDEREERRAALEREREDLLERLDAIQAPAAEPPEEHDLEQGYEPGPEPDDGPELDDSGPEFRP